MADTCSLDGCGRPAEARGWCNAHYLRWRSKGDPGTVEVRQRATGRICSIEGCERKHCAQGLCNTHLARLRRTGQTGAAGVEPRNPAAGCLVEGCSEAHRGRGYCSTHLQRLRKRGTVALPHDRGNTWIGDDAGYSAVHQRLRLQLGPASRQVCVSCGRPASDWAYDHRARKVQFSSTGLPFTTDLSHYQPMCRVCHKAMDLDFTPRTCDLDGCDRPFKARGLCSKHYQRALKESRRGRSTEGGSA